MGDPIPAFPKGKEWIVLQNLTLLTRQLLKPAQQAKGEERDPP